MPRFAIPVLGTTTPSLEDSFPGQKPAVGSRGNREEGGTETNGHTHLAMLCRGRRGGGGGTPTNEAQLHWQLHVVCLMLHTPLTVAAHASPALLLNLQGIADPTDMYKSPFLLLYLFL